MNVSEKVLEIYNFLRNQNTLAPSPEVNSAFSELVTIALQNSSEQFSPEVEAILPELHAISSDGEYQLEQFWAERVISDPFPKICLEGYPYYHNYELLGQLEYQSLRVLGERTISKVLFVGSGPLPLAAIILAKHYGIEVVCIDRDAQAVSLSSKLIHILGLENLITIKHADANTDLQAGDFDVVFVAALVGETQEEKLKILDNLFVSIQPGALVVIRTAHGNRRLLYPHIDEHAIKNFMVHAVILPKNEVVNSVIIAEKPILDSVDVVIKDNSDSQIFNGFRPFAYKCISDQYNFRYNPLWHKDIDTADKTYGAEKANLFAAYVNGKMVGTIAIRPLEQKHEWLRDRFSNQQVGAVWRFFIDPQYSHTSVANRLHSKLEEFARKAGYEKLYAHEQGFVTGALGKYISNGYTPISEDHDQLETIHVEKKL